MGLFLQISKKLDLLKHWMAKKWTFTTYIFKKFLFIIYPFIYVSVFCFFVFFFKQEQVQQILWLLKHGLLQQLHTYVYLAPTISLDTDNVRVGSRDIGGTGTLGSHGTSSPASTSIPTPTVHEPPPLNQEPSSLSSQQQAGYHPDITHDALHRAVVQLSQPASESDLGSGE